MSGASEKAARQVEEAVARSSSPTIKAKGAQMAAQLRARSAALSFEAAQAQQTFNQKERFQKQDIGYKYSALAQQGREHNDEMQIKREEIAAELEKALAAERASGGAAQMKQMYELQKDNETRGIYNVADGEPLLKAQGTAMFNEAAKLDDEANRLEVAAGTAGRQLTPMERTRVDALKEKAGTLRGQARLQYTYRGRDPVQAGKLSDEYAEGQSVASLVDDIKNIYDDSGRRFLSTNDKQAAVQAKATELAMKLKTAWQLGVLSKNDQKLIEQATGGDPTKGWEPGVVLHALGLDLGQDPEAFKARLDTLSQDTEQSTFNKMRVDGFDGDREGLFHHKTAPENSPDRAAVKALNKDQTPGELEKANREGAKGITGAVRTGVQAIFYGTTPNKEADAAIESTSLKFPGLNEDQAKAAGVLFDNYKAGDKRAGQLLVEQAKTDRPDLSLSMMKALRDNAPDLYAQARKGLTNQAVIKQLDYEDQNALAVNQTTTADLAQQLKLADDPSAKRELVRRATSGDKEAQKYILDHIMMFKGKR
jgi:hypothetical protein